MKLALAFTTPVEELMRRMTWREFRLWRVHLENEPIGEDRADYQAAMIAHRIDEYVWAKCGGKGQRPKLLDNVIDWWKQRGQARPQSSREKRANLLAALGVLGKTKPRRGTKRR